MADRTPSLLRRINNGQTPDITTAEKLAAALRDPGTVRYKDVPEAARVRWLGELILDACGLKNQDPGGVDVSLHATALDAKMIRDPRTAGLLPAEITEAVRDGLFGDYGEYYGITAISLYRFVRAYLSGPKRRETAVLIRQSQEAEEAARRQGEIRARCEALMRGGYVPGRALAPYRPKTVNMAIGSRAHREKIRRQAERILEESKQEANNF